MLSIPRVAQMLPAEHAPVCSQLNKLLQMPIAAGGFADWQIKASSIDLMLRLLSEQKRGSKSRWAPYIQTLSRELPPVMWDETVQRKCLDGTSGEEGVRLRFSRRAAERELLVRCGAANETAADEILQSWAIHVVTARTYEKINTRAGGGGCALVPVGDLLNHDTTPNCHWSRDAITNKFEIVTAMDVGADDELTMSYGSKTNQELLTNYGFALSDNPYDGVMIDIVKHDTPSGSQWLRLPLSRNANARALPDTLRTLRSLLRSNASLFSTASIEAEAAGSDAKESSNTDAEMASIIVGDEVEAEYKSSGQWFRAEVVELLEDRMVLLRWDDGDVEDRVKPISKLWRPSSTVALEAASLSVVRSSCLESREGWAISPEHTGACQVYRASLVALADGCADFAGRALMDLGRPLADRSQTNTGLEAQSLADILHSIWRMDVDGRLQRVSDG